MIFLLLVVFQCLILLILTKNFSRSFFFFWFLLTRSKNWAMRITSITLLPGTVVHELSHWFIAELLRVPTGEIDFMPKFDEENGIRMGSVAIAKKDLFRRAVIGIAPLFSGLVVIFTAAYFLPTPLWNNFSLIQHLPLLVIIFLVSNTMFSSKKDLEFAFPFFLFLIIAAAAWWYFSLPVPLWLISSLNSFSQKLFPALSITIGINIFFLIIVRLLTIYFEKFLRRKIVILP
jgi:hypothetical protein